jgi:hypothetical protein
MPPPLWLPILCACRNPRSQIDFRCGPWRDPQCPPKATDVPFNRSKWRPCRVATPCRSAGVCVGFFNPMPCLVDK